MKPAIHTWYWGDPDSVVDVRVSDAIGRVGWNQPVAPLVSAVLPTRVDVPAFQVGTSAPAA